VDTRGRPRAAARPHRLRATHDRRLPWSPPMPVSWPFRVLGLSGRMFGLGRRGAVPALAETVARVTFSATRRRQPGCRLPFSSPWRRSRQPGAAGPALVSETVAKGSGRRARST